MSAIKTIKIKVLQDEAGRWFFHVKARNGKKKWTSGETFVSKGNAIKAANRCADDINLNNTRAVVEVEEPAFTSKGTRW